jgi:lipopolysaccharide export system permease protein
MRLGRPLDRYLLGEFTRIFAVTALGFPVLVIVIDLTDNLGKYLERQLPWDRIAWSYVYAVPETMFQVLPAAVLFATVFTIGALTRHSEITAAKASGISFYRLLVPIAVGATGAAGLGLALGEAVPIGNVKRAEVLEEKKYTAGRLERLDFTYVAEGNRVLTVGRLNAAEAAMEHVRIERPGRGPEYPTVLTEARRARWHPRGGWTLDSGVVHILPGDSAAVAVSFLAIRERALRERPVELLASPKAPDEMGRAELARYIAAMERSGSDVNPLRVDRMLKVAIPATCVIILLFGAPLATSNQRGGAAYGIGIALGTTVLFLMAIQLTKAMGGKGFVSPELAAWLPNLVFAAAGMWLLTRVRT